MSQVELIVSGRSGRSPCIIDTALTLRGVPLDLPWQCMHMHLIRLVGNSGKLVTTGLHTQKAYTHSGRPTSSANVYTKCEWGSDSCAAVGNIFILPTFGIRIQCLIGIYIGEVPE